jgi:co-chaperonin GroES (HSP10)
MDLSIKTEIDLPEGDERRASQLPKPQGYKMLIALPELEEKTDGGVIIPGATLDREQTASIVGFVIELGPLCYMDTNKFPTGAWCKQGDWVIFRAYSGTRIKVHGKEFRLINDDTVEAVVEDPRGVKRV